MSVAKVADAASSSYPSSIKSAYALEDVRAELDQIEPELVERTWRKVDWAILPLAVILYLAAYIDRCDVDSALSADCCTICHLTCSLFS